MYVKNVKLPEDLVGNCYMYIIRIAVNKIICYLKNVGIDNCLNNYLKFKKSYHYANKY